MGVRQPQVQISLGGTQLTCVSVSLEQHKKAKSATFTAKFPLAYLENNGCGLDWFDGQADIQVTINISIDGSDTQGDSSGQPLFAGAVDKYELSLTDKGQIVTITGRDASAVMHRTKSVGKYTNQTSSQVVSSIASAHGLSVVSDSSIQTGKIYTAEQAAQSNGESEWAYMHRLAEREGKVLSIIGNQVYYMAADDQSLPPLMLWYQEATDSSPAQANFISATMTRNLEVAKSATVMAKSWDHKKAQVVQSQSTAAASGTDGTGEMLMIGIDPHHSTQDQVKAHATGRLKNHLRHEMDLTVVMPGDPTISPMMTLQFSGSPGGGFDQTFNIDSVSHKVEGDKYEVTVSTKAAKKGRSAS